MVCLKGFHIDSNSMKIKSVIHGPSFIVHCSLLLLFFLLGQTLWAQSEVLDDLQAKRRDIQQQIAETESLLTSTKKDVGSQLHSLNALTSQIGERRRYLDTLSADVRALDTEISTLDRQLTGLRRDLSEKRKRYESSVQYLHKNRSIQEKLMFIFSAQTLAQTYRRLRYVREYATYQRLQGEEIQKKQAQLEQKQAELAAVKAGKEAILLEQEQEQAKLQAQEKQQRNLVANLRKRQKSLQNTINKKKKEATQLNNRIDRLIAEELERARKQAAEEAKREAAAAGKSGKEGATASGSAKPSTTKSGGAGSASEGTFATSRADRELSGSFVSNRGRLPMPLTGSYLITSHYGQYDVAGLKNVKLDNKGIDIQGKPGAQARAVFDGRVAAVFRMNGLVNVLVRHGAYISVYCNLSSATVKTGDAVKTRQTLGPIYSDKADGNRTILHFQLRKEKEKLNPEPWLER